MSEDPGGVALRPLLALVEQWRKEADELEEATLSQWVEPGVKRACADELAALLAAVPRPQDETP